MFQVGGGKRKAEPEGAVEDDGEDRGLISLLKKMVGMRHLRHVLVAQ